MKRVFGVTVGPGGTTPAEDEGVTNEQVIYWQNKAAKLAQDVSDLNAKIQTLEAQIAQQNTWLENGRKAADKLAADNQSLQKQVDAGVAIKAERDYLRDERINLDSALKTLKGEHEALILERDEIKKQRNKAMSDYETCMSRLNEALNNNILLTSQLDQARQQIEDTDARTAAFIRKAYAQQYKPDLFTRFRNLRVVPFGNAPPYGTPQTRIGASLIWALGALYLIGRIE